MHIAIYSKKQNKIVYYNNDEDIEDPLIDKYTIEQTSKLLKYFAKTPKPTQ
jgi:hypothetical protein